MLAVDVDIAAVSAVAVVVYDSGGDGWSGGEDKDISPDVILTVAVTAAIMTLLCYTCTLSNKSSDPPPLPPLPTTTTVTNCYHVTTNNKTTLAL